MFIQVCLILVMMVKSSTLIGFQHQNENLNRDTFLGNLSPITGGLLQLIMLAIFIQEYKPNIKLVP